MKIALTCIAKNEDYYIDEWIKYHLKIGFDNIFIYENNWRSKIRNNKVIKIPFDGTARQVPAYNDFIKKYKHKYNWVAFFDVDEFLVLKKHKNIHEFLYDYRDHDAVGINWVLFGDNNLSLDSGNYSLIERFTKRQNNINFHIKTIVKPSRCLEMRIHNHTGNCVDTNYKKINGTPFNHEGDDSIAQLNHYFCKTREEFKQKIERGRATTTSKRTMESFDVHNFNEKEDLSALKFYKNIK